MMEKTLWHLFDFQKFSQNARLAAVIADTEERFCNVLTDDELEAISAAGEIPPPETREEKHDE